jgi:membrane-bound serine protease (ClpP class)
LAALGVAVLQSVLALPASTCRGQEPEPPAAKYSRAVIIRFEGVITPLLEQYFFRKLDRAEKDGADLVIVEIESPGGFVEQSFNVAERLRDLDWARTVAYVPHEALSGAAFVALGCDEIVMAEDAMLGDAGPIFLDEAAMFQHVPEKIRSDLAARVRALAEAKGRSPALAEAMVDMDLIVYPVRNTQTGRETFMSQAEIDSLGQPDLWEKGKPLHESREDHFLEVTGKRALELGLAQAIVSGRRALEERYRLESAAAILQPGGIDTAVYVLNLPIVTGLLFVIGLVALYVEFSTPGIGMGLLTAGLCFVLFFWSRFLGGTAGWLELLLFFAGLVFLGVELFVLPGFGIAGISGALLLLASLILAGQEFFQPRNAHEWQILTGNLLVVTLSGATFLLVAVVLSRYFGSIPFLSRLTLAPPEPVSASGDQPGGGNQPYPVPQGPGDAMRIAEVQIGDFGTTESALRPAGKARFGNLYLDVTTDGDFIPKGSRVQVVRLSGSRIVVIEVTA